MPSKVSGRFVQVLESYGGQAYRMELKSRGGVELSRLKVLGVDALDAKGDPVLLCEDVASDGRCVTYVSITLASEVNRFSVAYENAVVAKMSPLKKALMIQQRDIRMCNPAVDGGYSKWREKNKPKSEGAVFSYNPLISVVTPLFNTPSEYLREMIDSVLAQTYGNWELLLVNASPQNESMQSILEGFDDNRIRILPLEDNYGIAGNTNKGIEAAWGDYIGFLDHDDTLDPCALEEYVRAINKDAETDLLFCDEDVFSTVEEGYRSPIFKPGLNLDLLYSHNYVEHFLMVSRTALEKVELSSNDVSGAQDYDLTLKVLEIARSACHVPKVLYHWRIHPGSTNGGQMDSKPYAIAAGAVSLKRHFERRQLDADSVPTWIPCVYQTVYRTKAEHQTTVVIDVSKRKNLERCLDSLFEHERGSFDSCIIVGASNDYADCLQDRYAGKVALYASGEKCFADRINEVISIIRGGLVVVCQDTVRFTQEGCLNNLKGFCARDDVGVAAPKLFYFDGLTQHAGLCVKQDGSIGYINQNFTKSMGGGYLGMAECSCDYSAVSPACFMVKKESLDSIGGLCERYKNPLAVMLDLCLAFRLAGKVTVVSPDANAVNVAPVLWKQENGVALGKIDMATLDERWTGEWRREILYHPSVNLDSSYPRLSIERYPRLCAIKLVLKATLKR